MKPGIIIAGVVAAVAIAFGVYMVDVDMSGEIEAPDVDIAVEGGELPEIDAEVGSIETGTEEITVTVPTVDVNPAEDGDDVVEEDVAENANN